MQRMCMDEEFVAGCRVRRRWSTGKMRLGESNAMIQSQVACVVDVRLVLLVSEEDGPRRVTKDARWSHDMEELILGFQ